MKKLVSHTITKFNIIADISWGRQRNEVIFLYPNDELFKWTSCLVVVSVWRKLRKKMDTNQILRFMKFSQNTLTVNLIFPRHTSMSCSSRSHCNSVFQMLLVDVSGFMLVWLFYMVLTTWWLKKQTTGTLLLKSMKNQPLSWRSKLNTAKHFKKLLNWVTFMVDVRRPASIRKSDPMDKHRLSCRLPCDHPALLLSWTCHRSDIYAERTCSWYLHWIRNPNCWTISLRNCVLLNLLAAKHDQLYSGDPTFSSQPAGMGNDGRHRVTNWPPFLEHSFGQHR